MNIGANFPTLPPLKQLNPIQPPQGLAPPSGTIDFGQMLTDKFLEVNQMQKSADAQVHEMLTGGHVNQAEVLTAVQKADMSFRLLMQIRNKLLEAYQQLNQMQI
jgi:flagellar hook-basal body complex protein FliE